MPNDVSESKPDWERLIRSLRLAEKEGLSVEDYVRVLEEFPETYERYCAEEYGIPARKITLLVRYKEIAKCVLLTTFLEDVIGSNVFLNSRFVFEVDRDLEASIYLALAGHYRQAIAILRFALENALLEQYIQLHGGEDKWERGELFVPTGKRLIESVFPNKYQISASLKEHSATLSRYVHVQSPVVASGINEVACSIELFDEWQSLFTHTCELITMIMHAVGVKYTTRPRWELFHEATGRTESELLDEIWKECPGTSGN